MNFIKTIIITLGFCPLLAYSDNKNLCYALISYGYKNSADKAKRECLNLTPGKKKTLTISNTFKKSSLYSSIYHRRIFVQDLHESYKKDITTDNDFIILGHSRGSEMALHYTGKHNPNNLKALVLFATPISVIDAIKSKILGTPTQVSKNTSKSIRRIKNKSLPIILFHQKHDKLVSYKHSELIANFLKRQGFKEIYLITLKTGAHKDLIDDTGYKILQSFYKHNGLPHDAKYATLTQQELSQYKVL
ncbi:hypothetical protein HYV10_02660 [Candidatus Dependentiae bacterium]|nr:hypothetical protein [Candidatus Dependentiae bacterium]